MVKKLKVAICLVGIIRDKSAVPAYIKEMFTKIGDDHDIEFDYYCHFWKNDKLYPYYINDDWLGTTLPKEDDASVQQVIDTLNPKAVTHNSYSDMLDLYLCHGSNHQVDYSEHLSFFINKTIDKDYFINLNNKDPAKYFDCWWRFHNDWIEFAHLTGQFFAAEQCLKTIVKSDIHYDAILKWRYDQLFYTTPENVNRLVENLKSIAPNQIALDWMRRGLAGQSEVVDITNHLIEVKNNPLDITVDDTWWIVNVGTATLLSNYLTVAFANIRKYHSVFWLRGPGQHAFFYYALWSLKINFHIAGWLGIQFIRDPTVLPLTINLFDLSDPYSELGENLAKQSQTESQWGKQVWEEFKNKKYCYNTIKNFNFLNKEKLDLEK
jgi:hypothetical protein